MFTKRLLLMTIALAMVSVVNINPAAAIPLWEFGVQDQSWSEFATTPNGSFEPERTINFGIVSAENPAVDSGADAPGYLNAHNPWDGNNWIYTPIATERLTFAFTLESDYRQLDLAYGRFGSEIDSVYFDGHEIFQLDGTAEAQHDLFEYIITGDILAGEHTLSLAYSGGGVANGHFIDFVRLENGVLASASIPEPGTLFLVGTGIMALATGCRRKIKPSS